MFHKHKLEQLKKKRQLETALGRTREELVLAECNKLRTLIPWLRSSKVPRLATVEEDKHGIDVVIPCNIGELYLQVKSGKAEARRFRQQMRMCPGYYKKNIAVIIFPKFEPDRLQGEVISALIKSYEALEKG